MPLFPENKPQSPSVVLKSETPLSKDQKAFNNLIRKIEARRAVLADWETAIPLFRQKYANSLLPLDDRETELQCRLARALDAAHRQKGLTKAEKRKLTVMIVDLAEDVLGKTEHDEMKALYNEHSQSDFDAEEAAHLEAVKSALEGALGMDLGEDVDMRSPEEVMQRLERQFQAQQEDWEDKESRRRKSAREQAREARLEAEEKKLSQSIRDVYRQLASSLHPDREPDPTERQRKTELMQRANDAYDKGNLLQLLELQLQLEHIDEAHLAGISPQRLRHYLKILKGQLADLDQEIERVADEFALQFGLPPYQKLAPQGLMPMLLNDIAIREAGILQLQQHCEAASDPRRLKTWLKTIKPRRQAVSDFDLPF